MMAARNASATASQISETGLADAAQYRCRIEKCRSRQTEYALTPSAAKYGRHENASPCWYNPLAFRQSRAVLFAGTVQKQVLFSK